MISISLVSHNQFDLVLQFLKSVSKISKNNHLFFIITINTPEEICEKSLQSIIGANYKLIINSKVLGFGTNHNNAAKYALGNIFIISNPDIEVISLDLEALVQETNNPDFLLAPLCLEEDISKAYYDYRSFPFPHRIIIKKIRNIFNLPNKFKSDDDSRYAWFPGYFMIVDINLFNKIGGFDTKFFMYGEDVDLCLRVKKEGIKILNSDHVVVRHIGQFQSHKSINYLFIHIASLVRLNLRMLKSVY
jgi:hypothetical protein